MVGAILNGNDGNDLLLGGSGGTLALPDILDGGEGNDRLVGGTGVSNIFGRAGDDTIVWNEFRGSRLNLIDGGSDTGTNFRDTLQVFVNGAAEAVNVSAGAAGQFDVDVNGQFSRAASVEGLILEMMGRRRHGHCQ